MKIVAIIPARYGSSRFPGKPLVDIGGKTMIRRVYEQALKAKQVSQVVVATDDQRIYDEINLLGGTAIMTSGQHQNGTERCAEVAQKLEADVIVNIQGDEPFIQPEQIDLLAAQFISKSREVEIATLIKAHPLDGELRNSARIKVVVNKELYAMYFSRSIIPFQRDSVTTLNIKYYKHIGLYAFKKQVLLELVKLPPSSLEIAESLEQLRWLENGYRIKCAITDLESASIDTPEDLKGLSFPF